MFYTNVGKLYSNEAFINILKSLIDVAGGAAITIPSADDYSNVELKPIIDKYMSAAVSGDQRFKLLLAVREVIALLGGLEAVLHIHAEGSMEASRIELYRSYDYTEAKQLIADLLSTT